jgi:hypothetical protein
MQVAYTLFAFAVFFAIDLSPVSAEVYRPWCAQYMSSTGDGTTNCSFSSYEQCMMTARGAGAYCVQNPWYLQYGSGQRGTESTGHGERQRRR